MERIYQASQTQLTLLAGVACVIFCALMATTAIAATNNSGTENTDTKSLQTEYAGQFQKIAPGTYVRFGKHLEISRASVAEIANTGFIIGLNSIAIVDPGGSLAAARAMLQAIRQISALPISHVFITHQHPDHSLGLFLFLDQDLWRAAVAEAGPDDAEQPQPLIMGHPLLWGALLQNGDFFKENFTDVEKDKDLQRLLQNLPQESPIQSIKTNQTIDLGQRVLSLNPRQGAHSDADITIFDNQTSTLWAGDLIVNERLPALDGSLNAWLSEFDTLASELENLGTVTVVPGHGRVDTWPAVARQQHTYLLRLRDFARNAVKQGQSLSAFLNADWPWPQVHWELFGAQHKRNSSRAYTELEWE